MRGYIQRICIQSRGTTVTVITYDKFCVGRDRYSAMKWRERGGKEGVVSIPIVGEDTERSCIQIRGAKGHVTTGKSMSLWKIGT